MKISAKRQAACDWEYVEQVETFIKDLIMFLFNHPEIKGESEFLFDNSHSKVTVGFEPRYDFGINGVLFEIKTSDTPNKLTVEYRNNDGLPSGIYITTADFYVYVSPGRSEEKEVKKIRILPKAYLITKLGLALNRGNPPIRKSSTTKSRWIDFNPFKLNGYDGWIADIDVETGELLKIGNKDWLRTLRDYTMNTPRSPFVERPNIY